MTSQYAALFSTLEQIFDVFSQGLWISRDDSTCVFVNKKYEELSGYSRDQMVGRKATDIVSEGLFDTVVNPEVIRTGKTVSRVQTLPNGQHLNLEGHPIFDETGRTIMCVTFISDISTIVEMEEHLARQRDVLKVLCSTGSGISGTPDPDAFVEGPSLDPLARRARSLAVTDVTVLILGETGVGKDVLARRLHAMSPRASKPFIKCDCGAISPSLIESELFGYVGGAFSGASRSGRMGIIEAVDGGTLFLDEIGELPLDQQTRLLRFLQDGVIVRVGSHTPRTIDVRVIAATNRDLGEAVRAGEFRSDLYYRLRIAELRIPPLRERQEDILPMAGYFLSAFARRYGRSLTLSPEAESILQSYAWPGNVRELRNIMQEVAVTCTERLVRPEHLSLAVTGAVQPAADPLELNLGEDGRDYHDIMREMEAKVIKAAVDRCGGNMAAAARLLRMDRSTIFRKIRELGRRGLWSEKTAAD